MSTANLQKLVTPIVTDVLDGKYQQRTDEWKSFMKEITGMPYDFHQLSVMSGFGNAVLKNPGQTTSYDQAQFLYTVQMYYQTYALAFALTKEMIDDSKVNVDTIKLFSEQLVMSLLENREIITANVLNTGFNPLVTQGGGGDGQPLFSANHPSAGGAPNRSNILLTPAVLSQTSLEQMLINISQAKDAKGKFIRLTPEYLIIPPALAFQARTILGSELRSDTANNSINALKGHIKDYRVVTRLTSPSAYFMTTQGYNDLGVVLVRREAPATAKEGDFDTDSLRFKIRERFSVGWGDFNAMWGTTGI